MGTLAVCKHLTAIYEDERISLRGPINTSLNFTSTQTFTIQINQAGSRTIDISSESDVPTHELTIILSYVERFLMLTDGYFVPLKQFSFSDSDICTPDLLFSVSNNEKFRRLSYYNSSKFFKNSVHTLISFEEILTSEFLPKWVDLLNELGPVHQVFLYFESNAQITPDIQCAFLIELAEPLVDIIKAHTNYFASLEPGNWGTSLKMCLDALISQYGEGIFHKEFSGPYTPFLNALVNSRVNIMHIKRNQKSPSLDGKQSALYLQKLSLLYRVVLFEILGLDRSLYLPKLIHCVSELDKWGNISDRFLKSL